MLTINSIISSGSDDAHEQNNGQVVINSTTLLNVDGVNEWNGFIFRNINIPEGAIILNSYLTVRMYQSALDEPDVTFYGLDIQNPPTFTTALNNLSSRTRTSASVDWSNADTGQSDVNTSDLSSIIQELLDSYGPYESGSIGIVMTSRVNDANRDTSIISYEGSSSFCPRLTIEYTEGNLGPSVVLDTPNEQVFTTNQPTLLFTGTDPDSDDLVYEIQISDNPNFIGGVILCDNHLGDGASLHPNPTGSLNWLNVGQVDDRFGQGYQGYGGILYSVQYKFHSDEQESTDGYVLGRIYEHAGTFGVDGTPLNPAEPQDTPTPGWIAESESIYFDGPLAGTVSTFKEFRFYDENRIRMISGHKYFTIADWVPINNLVYANTVRFSGDSISPDHLGNAYIDGASVPNNGVRTDFDLNFQIYEEFVLNYKKSDLDIGFNNVDSPGDTNPFNSGDQISFTIQLADALDNTVYYWKVRCIDPNGINIWSEWTTPRSFTINVESGGGNTYEDSLIIDRFSNFGDINNLELDSSLNFEKLVNIFTESYAVIEEFFNMLQINSLISNVVQVINEVLNIEKITEIIYHPFYTINTLLTISLLKDINSSGGFIFESSLNLNQVIDMNEGGGLSLTDYLLLNKDASINLSSSLIAGGIVSLNRLNEFNTLTTLSMLSELLVSNNLTMIGIGNSNSNVGLILSKSAFVNQNGGFNINNDLTLGRFIGINSLNVLSKEEFLDISKQIGIENSIQISFNSNLEISRDSFFVVTNDLELESILNIAKEVAFGIQVIGNLDLAVSLGIALLISLSGSSLSGDIITPPTRIYAIPSENRVYIIDVENRIYLIDSENRILKIKK